MPEKKSVEVVVFIPVGPPRPQQLTRHVIDTIESIKHYVTPDHQIVMMDDSKGANLGEELQGYFPDIDVVKSSSPDQGMSGEFYLAYGRVWKYIHAHYDYKVLLGMDCDALITGPNPERDAIEYFEKHPDVGNLGIFKVTATGEPHSHYWPRRRIRIETSFVGKIFYEEFHKRINELVKEALKNGYKRGYHIISAAQFVRPELMEALISRNLFDEELLRYSRLKNDHLTGLMSYIVGYKLADFSRPDDIMAIEWRGLPMSPEELARRGKKVIHSTRFWKDMDEDAIRDFFRKRREAGL